MSLQKIPSEMGNAGAFIPRGGAAGSPDLYTCLDLLAQPLPALTGTADSTYSANESLMAKQMCQRVVDCAFPGKTLAQADVDAINAGAAYDAATSTSLGKLKVDLNACGFAAVSDTIAAGGAYDNATRDFLNNALTRINLICSGLFATTVPTTYTAVTQGILSSLVVRANARIQMA